MAEPQSQSLVGHPGGPAASAKDDRAPGCYGVWQWFWEAPWKRWPFAVFLLFAALTFLWIIMYVTSPFTGYLLAGLSAIVMAAYGANHFRILLGLKEEVDKMSKLNSQFREENAQLKAEVDKLNRARVQLKGVQDDLSLSNQKLKENLRKFRELDENLKQLGTSNLDGLERVQKQSKAVMDRWNANLLRNEKAILNKVFDEMEMKDDNPDMSKTEFEQFLNALPKTYRDKFHAMGKTFEEIAGDDALIQYDEFMALVDEMCNDIVREGGSH